MGVILSNSYNRGISIALCLITLTFIIETACGSLLSAQNCATEAPQEPMFGYESVSDVLVSFASLQTVALAATDIKHSPAPQIEFEKDFEGTINGYPVSFHLQRKGTVLTGYSYYIPRKTTFISICSELELKGEVGSEGVFALEEYKRCVSEEKSVLNGKLHGRITQTERGLQISGIWTGANSDKQLSLELMEKGTGTQQNRKIKTAQMFEHNRKLAGKVEAFYPKLEGSSDKRILQCNRFIREHVARSLGKFKKAVLGEYIAPENWGHVSLGISYKVKFIDRNLISIVFEEETDYGGAHPNHYESFVNFSFKTGREIRFHQLFKRNVDYDKVINKLCRDVDESGFFSDIDSGNPARWHFDDQGIYIHFEVNFASGGNAAVFIPYKDIEDILDPASPIGVLTARSR